MKPHTLRFTIATLVYQLITLARHPASSLAWSAGMIAVIGAVVVLLRDQGRRNRLTLPDDVGGACGGCTKCGPAKR